MKPAQAQLYFTVVLLEAVRDDIRENKKLNVHLYEALKRSLYKPGAFFKGFIFPLLDVRIPPSQSDSILQIHSKVAR